MIDDLSVGALELVERAVLLGLVLSRADEDGLALQFKVGDRILFGKYAGSTVKIDGEEILVLREEDILGVLA